MEIIPSRSQIRLVCLPFTPSANKQPLREVEQYPRAPTSTAKIETAHPFLLMAGTSLLWYLESFWEFLAQKFSSQGQVSSIRTTVLILLENKTRSGRSVEIAI